MVTFAYGEELQQQAKEFIDKMPETNPPETNPPEPILSRLTLMSAVKGGYVVLSQSGTEQVVLFAGCLRECLEFMGKNIERV